MKANQSEHLRRSKEFEAAQNRLRANQIETMIAAFDRMCIDLGHQIEAEETRARISDPTHFAYPTYAKAAGERRAKLQRQRAEHPPFQSLQEEDGQIDRDNNGYSEGHRPRHFVRSAAHRFHDGFLPAIFRQ